jgi:hypothetical protein
VEDIRPGCIATNLETFVGADIRDEESESRALVTLFASCDSIIRDRRLFRQTREKGCEITAAGGLTAIASSTPDPAFAWRAELYAIDWMPVK